MTRVDFYLQQPPASASLEMRVCQLVDKVFHQGHQVYIYTPDPASSARLDELLWTFSAGSFIPHAVYVDDRAASPVPILISHLEPPTIWQDVLVTLRPEVPGCFSRFERVAEFVGAQDDDKQPARERFRFYRDRGYPLETHDL